jgi:hypothetical protein
VTLSPEVTIEMMAYHVADNYVMLIYPACGFFCLACRAQRRVEASRLEIAEIAENTGVNKSTTLRQSQSMQSWD